MRLPDPLPTRFTAALHATIQCRVEHGLIRGDATVVEAKGLSFDAEVDVEAGTVRVVGFPAVEETVPTSLGDVATTVSVDGDPEGRYDADTGHVEVDAVLTFRPAHLLARRSRVSVRLHTDGAVDAEGVVATGDPLHADDGLLVLVGEGTFDGGSLDGGRVVLAITATLDGLTVHD